MTCSTPLGSRTMQSSDPPENSTDGSKWSTSTFSTHPGQFAAIVGRSGSGKSTLASLLLGLYPPTSGRVRYDGVDLSKLDLRSVRRQLGIVTQRPYLFGSSIRA